MGAMHRTLAWIALSLAIAAAVARAEEGEPDPDAVQVAAGWRDSAGDTLEPTAALPSLRAAMRLLGRRPSPQQDDENDDE
jgi:hypothetical protein